MEESSPTIHFGNWLKRQIENLALQQREFAISSGIGFGALRRWIGSRAPTIRGANLVKLAKGLGISRELVETKLAEAAVNNGETFITETGVSRKIPLLPSPFRNFVNGLRDARDGFIISSIQPFEETLRSIVIRGSRHPLQNGMGNQIGEVASALVAIIKPVDLTEFDSVSGASYVIWLRSGRAEPLYFKIVRGKRPGVIIAKAPSFDLKVRSQQLMLSEIDRLARIVAIIDYVMIPAPPKRQG